MLSIRLASYCEWNFLVSYFFSFNFKMPKYAVAVGRKVGVYDTWAECQKQVVSYPNAKYKKFDSAEEAERFICRIAKDSSDGPDLTRQTSVENVSLPSNLMKVEKVSPSNGPLNIFHNKLVVVEEKMTKMIERFSVMESKIDKLMLRLSDIEGKRKLEANTENTEEQDVKKVKLVSENEQFHRKDDFVVVYTDGACSNNGRTGAKAGIGVWFGHSNPLNLSAPVKGPPTNNNAEIQAAAKAILQAKKAGISKLSIHTDSKFVISCITQWIHRWKKNNWKLSTGGDVKNKEELLKLDKAVRSITKVEWVYVAGHKGIEGNEYADRLARSGAELYKTNVTYGDISDHDETDFE